MEMNELTRSLVRVEELMNAKQYPGALNCLGISQNHALTAVKLIKDQAALLTKQQLEYISLFGELQTALEEKAILVKDVEIQKERADMQYKRAESAEAEIKELDEQEPVARVVATSDGLNVAIEQHDAEGINKMTHGDPVYARPVPAKSVPDGFAIVPIEPTSAMLDAGVAMALQVSVSGEGGWSKYLSGLWQQMLSAAK